MPEARQATRWITYAYNSNARHRDSCDAAYQAADHGPNDPPIGCYVSAIFCAFDDFLGKTGAAWSLCESHSDRFLAGYTVPVFYDGNVVDLIRGPKPKTLIDSSGAEEPHNGGD